MTPENDYLEALKLGKKEYKNCIAKGRGPYLPVLDEILSHEPVQTEQKLGLIHVPLEFIVGTSTMGRTFSFAANFMPILGPKTEFAFKWTALCEAQVNEGIRDPIICYEYMNRYYVVEGNKRVSVLKYFGADSIPAIVTRKVPPYVEEDEDIVRYYELMKFTEITGIYTVEFSRSGYAPKLLKLMDKTEQWNEETQRDFKSVLFHFTKAYKFHGGDKLPITIGDALVAFMNVYGYDAMLKMTDEEYAANLLKTWSEIIVASNKEGVGLVMDPAKKEGQERKSLLSYILPSTAKKCKVAFLYPKSPENSDWLYAHELGRNYLEETFSSQITTMSRENVTEDTITEVLEEVIDEGAKIIFCVAPQMMQKSLKVAVEHPEVTILNCSLNAPYKYVRTYYARMYEAKFISGMVAGAMTENDKIAYIADYPIYGMIANINAFALGVASVNPRARIYLEWSTKKGYDKDRFLQENDIRYVSDQDMITPKDASRMFGFYKYEDRKARNLVMPLWNWGIFYQKMIQGILSGIYKTEGQSEGKALNYWWGMSAGVIDVIFSKHVPVGVQKLAEHMKSDLAEGKITPFYGEFYSQDGKLQNRANEKMLPEDIMKMDWLLDNIIGEIPPINELEDSAKVVVSLKGVEEQKE